MARKITKYQMALLSELTYMARYGTDKDIRWQSRKCRDAGCTLTVVTEVVESVKSERDSEELD
jgi:hypothetical protein